MVAFANKQRLFVDDRKREGFIVHVREVKYALFMVPGGG